MNMTQWFRSLMCAPQKKALPVLSFPSTQLLRVTVRELVSDSDLQAKGMKLVADRCNAAAAVSMMDLSVEAEAFGAAIHFSDDEVPTVSGILLETPEDAEALNIPPVGAGRTGLYINAIEKALSLITDRPVFAGVIGPFSLAGRLMGMSEIMVNCYEEPEMVEAVLEKASAFLIEYIKGYRTVGAHGVVVAEPAAGLLSPGLMEEFAAPYMKRIIDAVQDDSFAVIYHNCGNAVNRTSEQIASLGAMGYHFGNAVSMVEMLEKMPSHVPVMGNIDPAGIIRGGTPASVRQEVLSLLEACSRFPNFVLSSGCDIPPASPWANIDAFFDAADEYYSR